MSRRRGDHKFVCDVDGMTYHSRDKRITWDGKVVHYLNYYSRPMLDFYKPVKDDTSVRPVQLEVGRDTSQGSGYKYLAALNDDCFLVDENGEYVVDEDDTNITGCPWPSKAAGF